MSSPPADPRRRHVGVTPFAALAAFFCIGLVVGWVYHYLKRLDSGIDPSASWSATGVVVFLAAFVTVAALRTRAARRNGERLPAHRAVNLLVMGKACARAGAAVGGAYLGFAVGYLRPSVSVPGAQLVLVLLTVLAGIALSLGGIALEKACQITEPTDGAET